MNEIQPIGCIAPHICIPLNLARAELYRVQRLLGHSTPVMLARYGKLADDDLRDAVKAMK